LQDDVLSLLAARKGHFLLESGHHGDLWLDLELLCLRPRLVRPAAAELAERLSVLGVDAVCGPLVEGAQPAEDGLFPAGYRIPDALHSGVRNKRVAIVSDVVNAGSAVRGTFAALVACGATPVAVGALVVLGSAASEFAASRSVALESIAALPNRLWTPWECPLCVSGAMLENVGGFTG
jgi:orotate phosphoribosyltransferase